MFECADVVSEFDDPQADVRLDDEHIRCVPGDDGAGSVLLVGVVHDHPASVFRVAHLIGEFPPAVLAVELPPLAVSLFQLYARDQYVPPRLGGEMSMAIQAASDARIVGIDAPNRVYLRLLVERLRDDPPSIGLAKDLVRDFASGLGHALACRLGALIGAVTPLKLRVYSHIEYDCTLLDTPSTQADHEARHLSQRQAFLRAIDVPQDIQLIDSARERGMAVLLEDLRADSDVVAVVGMEHLDNVHAFLADAATETVDI